MTHEIKRFAILSHSQALVNPQSLLVWKSVTMPRAEFSIAETDARFSSIQLKMNRSKQKKLREVKKPPPI